VATSCGECGYRRRADPQVYPSKDRSGPATATIGHGVSRADPNRAPRRLNSADGLRSKSASPSTFWWGNQAGVFCACTIQLLLHVANRQEPRSFLSVDSTQPTVAGTRLGALQPSESASALHCLLGASYTSFAQEDRGCLDPGSILA